MANSIEVLEYLKNYPVFSNTTLKNRLDKDSNYTKLFLHRLMKRGLVYKIEKNKYTVFNDPFLIASRVIWPSYISCWSALKYHNLTEQVPNDIDVIVRFDKKGILFSNTRLNFIKTKSNNFFGYEKAEYGGFEVFIADVEKSIIDSALLRRASFSELEEVAANNIKKINISKFLEYLKKIGNKSLIKRFGYVFEKLGKDRHIQLKKYVDSTYIPLDYSKRTAGKKNKKWRLVLNA